MKSNYYESNYQRRGDSTGNVSNRKDNAPKHHSAYDQPEELSLGMLFQRLATGFKMLWIALKYRLLKMLGITGVKSKSFWRISLLKVTMLAVVIILVTQKDIRFSVNLKAPLAGIGQAEQPKAVAAANRSLSKFSLSDALPFGKKSEEETEEVSVSDLHPDQVNQYVGRFSKVAVAEMRKFGIPASIKMAQAILESQAGQSSAVKEMNNHFGKPLHQMEYVSAWENWRAHSLLLKNEYSSLFDDAYGYTQWAKGLQKLHYSSDKQYASKLITIIEKYELTLLDE